MSSEAHGQDDAAAGDQVNTITVEIGPESTSTYYSATLIQSQYFTILAIAGKEGR